MDDSSDSRFAAEVALLNGMPSTEITALSVATLDFLINSASSEDFQEILNNLASSIQLSPPQFRALVKFLLIVFQGAIKDTLSTKQLLSLLTLLQINTSAAQDLLSVWESKASKLVQTLVARTVASNKLLDMDWSFGVTASSDDCDQVGKTYLQVRMKIDGGSEGIKDLFFELSLDQFYSFLAELEKCKSFLDAITVV